jgi:hypothetical protein
MEQPDRPQMAIGRTRFTCWIPKATNTHPEYVILIAFPLQLLLRERPSMLRYTYIAYLINVIEGSGYSDHSALERQLNFSLLLVTVCNMAQEDAGRSHGPQYLTSLYPVYVIITVPFVS